MRYTRRRFLKQSLAVGVGLAMGVRAQREALRIGVVLPYSGVYAQLGQDITDGMLLYLEEVKNQAGGRPVQLVREDETADPAVALRKVTKLVEQDRVDLLTGLVSTASAYAVRDYVHNTRNVLIVSNAGGNALTRDRKSPYIFRTSFTSWQVSFPMGRWVAERVTKRVAVVAADYAFGRESVAAFKESFLAAGGQVVQETYTPLGSTDFSAVLTRLLQARPGAIFGFLAGSDAAIFLRQYAQFGLKGSIPLTTTGFTVEEDVIGAVGQAAEGAYSSLHWAVRLALPENQRFVQSFRRKFGRTPSVYSMQGYDTARVIVEAINALQGDTSNKDKLVEALEGVRFRGPRGLLEFDPKTHQVIQNVYVRQVRNIGNELANAVVADLGRVRDPG
ncbi:ABC transporter substrate-binding protein [Thermus thermophilus]|uniref:ABC transporter substrate-binding protein n=1 Tax=Thermus thermophilus TaxID=274 RepID=A0A7R7TGC1_THETH|nr:ABC transporter substrate-binding protein [Thermus thermophilus]BCP67621.1 ABC transporter substrate-binding protein [Thermus thermophilus]